MKKNAIEKVTGKVEMVVAPELETINGYTSEDCVSAIKNPKMRKLVEKYAKVSEMEATYRWRRAITVAEMTVDLRKEFGNDGNLAEFLGLDSKSEFSKMQRAGKLAIELKDNIDLQFLPPLSIVYELLVLDNSKKFREDANTADALLYVVNNQLTAKETREYVNSFRIEKKDEKVEETKADKVEKTKADKVEETKADKAEVKKELNEKYGAESAKGYIDTDTAKQKDKDDNGYVSVVAIKKTSLDALKDDGINQFSAEIVALLNKYHVEYEINL